MPYPLSHPARRGDLPALLTEVQFACDPGAGDRPAADLRGNSKGRKASHEWLFGEFRQGRKQYVCCVHCGKKMSPHKALKHDGMERDKISTVDQGGRCIQQFILPGYEGKELDHG